MNSEIDNKVSRQTPKTVTDRIGSVKGNHVRDLDTFFDRHLPSV